MKLMSGLRYARFAADLFDPLAAYCGRYADRLLATLNP